MRTSLAYTLTRHLVHLQLLKLGARLRYRRGIPGATFDDLVHDMKRSRRAIERARMIWETM